MNKFDVAALGVVLHRLGQSELFFLLEKAKGRGGESPKDSARVHGTESLELTKAFFGIHNIGDCLEATGIAEHQWNRSLLDNSSACEIFHGLRSTVAIRLDTNQYLIIAKDRNGFIDQPMFFGSKVNDSFPSATGDIKEAANCLAAECNTAAVFHLMRAVEVALRALARDREISFPDKPIDLKEWGEILPNLDSKVTGMREESAKSWGDPQIKEIQVRFYAEASQELRAFNEAWRRHLSHAREDGFYDRDYAKSVTDHVGKFMQKLAGKITEYTVTPKYWTPNEIKS